MSRLLKDFLPIEEYKKLSLENLDENETKEDTELEEEASFDLEEETQESPYIVTKEEERESNELVEVLNDSFTTLESLLEIESIFSNKVDSYELSRSDIAIFNASVKHVSRAVGIESFSLEDSSDNVFSDGEKAKEKSKGIIKRIVEAIKAFFKKIIKWFSNIFKKLSSKTKETKKGIDDFIKEINNKDSDYDYFVEKTKTSSFTIDLLINDVFNNPPDSTLEYAESNKNLNFFDNVTPNLSFNAKELLTLCSFDKSVILDNSSLLTKEDSNPFEKSLDYLKNFIPVLEELKKPLNSLDKIFKVKEEYLDFEKGGVSLHMETLKEVSKEMSVVEDSVASFFEKFIISNKGEDPKLPFSLKNLLGFVYKKDNSVGATCGGVRTTSFKKLAPKLENKEFEGVILYKDYLLSALYESRLDNDNSKCEIKVNDKYCPHLPDSKVLAGMLKESSKLLSDAEKILNTLVKELSACENKFSTSALSKIDSNHADIVLKQSFIEILQKTLGTIFGYYNKFIFPVFADINYSMELTTGLYRKFGKLGHTFKVKKDDEAIKNIFLNSQYAK